MAYTRSRRRYRTSRRRYSRRRGYSSRRRAPSRRRSGRRTVRVRAMRAERKVCDSRILNVANGDISGARYSNYSTYNQGVGFTELFPTWLSGTTLNYPPFAYGGAGMNNDSSAATFMQGGCVASSLSPIVCLTAMAQGVPGDQRIGLKITPRALLLKMSLQGIRQFTKGVHTTAGEPPVTQLQSITYADSAAFLNLPTQFRVIIWRDSRPGSTMIPGWSDIAGGAPRAGARRQNLTALGDNEPVPSSGVTALPDRLLVGGSIPVPGGEIRKAGTGVTDDSINFTYPSGTALAASAWGSMTFSSVFQYDSLSTWINMFSNSMGSTGGSVLPTTLDSVRPGTQTTYRLLVDRIIDVNATDGAHDLHIPVPVPKELAYLGSDPLSMSSGHLYMMVLQQARFSSGQALFQPGYTPANGYLRAGSVIYSHRLVYHDY